jgi:hypothetical protein
MNARTHRRNDPPRPLWSTWLWPLAAGAVTAVGIFVAGHTLGLVALVLVYLATSTFAVAMIWGMTIDTGVGLPAAVRWGLHAALAVVVLVGLCDVQPLYGLLVGVAVGVTSPVALTLVSTIRAQRQKQRTDRTAGPAPGVLVDKALLDRRFHEIVSQLTESEFPES